MPPGLGGLPVDVAFGRAVAVVIETGSAGAWRGRLASFAFFKCGFSPRVTSGTLQPEVMPLHIHCHRTVAAAKGSLEDPLLDLEFSFFFNLLSLCLLGYFPIPLFGCGEKLGYVEIT